MTPGETIALLEHAADEDGTFVLRAVAFKEGWTTSTAAEAEFTLATNAPEPGPEPDTPPPPRGSSSGCTACDQWPDAARTGGIATSNSTNVEPLFVVCNPLLRGRRSRPA